MSYYIYLVETKIEYTNQIINILTPYLFEGIYSIYQSAIKISETNNKKSSVIKIFQDVLKQVPNWTQTMLINETNRILQKSNKCDIINDLIKAVIKSNMMILTNTPPKNKDKMKIKHNITPDYFIHNIYIEIARNVFNNPFLFYDSTNNIEIKKNQRDILYLIKNSIKEAIRKMLPLNYILKEYIGESFENNNIDFENDDTDSVKIKKLLHNKNGINNDNDEYITINIENDKILFNNSELTNNKIKKKSVNNDDTLNNKFNDELNKSSNKINNNNNNNNNKLNDNYKLSNEKINHKLNDNNKINDN